jgi:hypothetical protein
MMTIALESDPTPGHCGLPAAMVPPYQLISVSA